MQGGEVSRVWNSSHNNIFPSHLFQFTECQDPLKVSCGIGAYRDNGGKPLVMDAVKEAKKR
jgi:aspartate/tyrosine/aromatic aminotransferase